MISREEILTFLREQKPVFRTEYQIAEIGLFGSFARAEAVEASDIDVLVEFLPDTQNLSDKKEALRSIIGKRFDRKVDICRRKYVKPYFKAQIEKSVIYV